MVLNELITVAIHCRRKERSLGLLQRLGIMTSKKLLCFRIIISRIFMSQKPISKHFFLYIYWNTFKLIKYLYFSIHLIFHLFLFILLIYFHTFYFSLLYQFSSLKTNSVGSHFCVASIETDLSHIFMTSCSELYRSIVLGRLWWCYICVYFI